MAGRGVSGPAGGPARGGAAETPARAERGRDRPPVGKDIGGGGGAVTPRTGGTARTTGRPERRAHVNDYNEQLDEVLAAYLEARDAGWAPRKEAILRCYPHLAAAIQQFFADQEHVDR